jgi:hypothetical protein
MLLAQLVLGFSSRAEGSHETALTLKRIEELHLVSPHLYSLLSALCDRTR